MRLLILILASGTAMANEPFIGTHLPDPTQTQAQNQGQEQHQDATAAAVNSGVSNKVQTLLIAPPANGSVQATAPCYVQQHGFFKRLQSLVIVGLAPIQERDEDCVQRESRKLDIEALHAQADADRAAAERARAEAELIRQRQCPACQRVEK